MDFKITYRLIRKVVFDKFEVARDTRKLPVNKDFMRGKQSKDVQLGFDFKTNSLFMVSDYMYLLDKHEDIEYSLGKDESEKILNEILGDELPHFLDALKIYQVSELRDANTANLEALSDIHASNVKKAKSYYSNLLARLL